MRAIIKLVIALLPRYFYPWQARVHVDVPTVALQNAN